MDRVKYSTIADVYQKYPTNTISKFKKIASRYGFTDDEARDYLATRVIHEHRTSIPKYMHIYSKLPHAYQMDTYISSRASGQPDYLMFINVNIRKAYAYEMNGKGSKEVLRSLRRSYP